MMCVANVDGYFKLVNDKLANTLGYTKEELYEYQFFHFIHENDLERTSKEIEKLAQGFETINFTNRFRTKSGQYKWFEWNSTPDVETGELYATARDVSDEIAQKKALKLSNQRFDFLMSDTHDMYLRYDPQNAIIDVKIGSLFTTFVTEEGMIGKTVNELLPPHISGNYTRLIDDTRYNKRSNSFAFDFDHEGEYYTHEVRLFPSADKYVFCIVRDITDYENIKRSLQANQKQLSLLIKYTPAAVAMFDTDIKYIQHSDKWLEDYNLVGPIIGRSHYDVFPDIKDAWKDDHQRVLKGEILKNNEEHWVRDDGEDVYLAWELHPWYNEKGEAGGIVMFTQVITEQVKARKKLEETVKELERSNLDLEQFAYISSHDLQEPLRMISNFSSLFMDQYGGDLDDTAKTYMRFVTDSADRMKKLIVSLLEFSKAGRSEINKKETDFNLVLEHQLKNLSLLISERNVAISYNNLPQKLNADSNQIGMLLYNLIANGIKFNKSERPTIDIYGVELEDKWQISVKDNGIGIAKKFKDKIFNTFQRLHKKDEYEGTGIGLALCKKIANRHGGDIWLENSESSGTIFSFTLNK